MKVVLAGGSGFLGRALVAQLAARGHEVVVLSRHPAPAQSPGRQVGWDPDGSLPATGKSEFLTWPKELDGASAVVNLAGAGMADKRWTPARKRDLRLSRVLSTRSLVAAVRAASQKPPVFYQGSAVGFYGPRGDEILDESFPPGDGLQGSICVAWEAEANPVVALGCRLIVGRSGVVLAKDGGALPKMARPFTFFVGGRVASGKQYLSWIHRDDWLAFVTWALETATVSGTYNVTAPEPVTNDEFSKAIGRALRRPSWIPVPGFVLRVLFGEIANDMLIRGQRVVPKRALEAGFPFAYPKIDAALNATLRKTT
jgi:uncharacterized protein (TIGR01777 family)